MKDYVINLIQNGQLSGEGYGQGHSAMEAFENGVANGSIMLPQNEEVEVLAVNNNGLGIKFIANQL